MGPIGSPKIEPKSLPECLRPLPGVRKGAARPPGSVPDRFSTDVRCFRRDFRPCFHRFCIDVVLMSTTMTMTMMTITMTPRLSASPPPTLRSPSGLGGMREVLGPPGVTSGEFWPYFGRVRPFLGCQTDKTSRAPRAGPKMGGRRWQAAWPFGSAVPPAPAAGPDGVPDHERSVAVSSACSCLLSAVLAGFRTPPKVLPGAPRIPQT